MKAPVIIFSIVDKSDVYNRYGTGPRTLPCGAPDLIGKVSKISPLTFVLNWRLHK